MIHAWRELKIFDIEVGDLQGFDLGQKFTPPQTVVICLDQPQRTSVSPGELDDLTKKHEALMTDSIPK